jgi:hypothetical protein
LVRVASEAAQAGRDVDLAGKLSRWGTQPARGPPAR